MRMRLESEKNRLAKYQILIQHKQYIDKLFWSRVQILNLIQAGILAGSYALRDKYLEIWPSYPVLSIGILVTGIILTIILLLVARLDWRDSQRNDAILYSLGDRLGIRWTAERGRFEPRGHRLFFFAFGLFLTIDSSLIVYIVYEVLHPKIPPAV
jgi:hypothetical protein